MTRRSLSAALAISVAFGILLGTPGIRSVEAYGSGDGQFIAPQGVATDLAGNVYVADTGNDRIQKFTSDGAFISKWGSFGTGNGQFNTPRDVATDAAGNVYVADTGNDRIQKFTSDGAFITEWGSAGSAEGQFMGAVGLTTDSPGNVYVVDTAFYTGNDRIQKFTSDGAFITEWGSAGYGDGEFLDPADVATDATGNVYIIDTYNYRIQKFTSDGIFITKWGSAGYGDGEFHGPYGSGPYGVATDAAGNVYVADTGNSRIQKFTSDGAFITKWGSAGSAAGQLAEPYGLATDTASNVYVADTLNNRIQKFTSYGSFILSWGDGSTAPESPPHPPAASGHSGSHRTTRVSRPTITFGPKPKVTSRIATFRFTTGQSGVRFQCKLTGPRAATALRQWRLCASPERYSNLRYGRKVFSVRAINASSTSAVATWSWTIVKRAGRKPLALPATRRRVTFRASCGFDYRCRARVTARAGKKVLARGRYSVPAHSSRRVAIRLTTAGHRALARKRWVGAKLTIVRHPHAQARDAASALKKAMR